MKRLASLSRHLRLVLAAALATPVAITLAASPASPAQAALGGVTKFEIDSNTTVTTVGNTDWVSKFAAGEVAVSNDANFTGDDIVQTDVGSASTAPSWLANCPPSNSDTVFKNSTSISDPDWTNSHETQSVTPKNDLCQSYFASDVVQTAGPRQGHIVAYVAFTRRVFNGDGSYYFLLSKGPNPDVRVDGDVVIQVDYGSQGQAQKFTFQKWTGSGTPTLGAATTVALNDPNVDLSPVQYFAEMAIDLTALGLAPDVDEVSTPASCQSFGFGRVISRTGNSPSATLKDDGEPVGLDANVCGSLIIKKELTASVPGTTDFPITITAPSGVTLPYPNPVLRVPGGTTTGGTPVDGNANPAPNATPTGNPITYLSLPVRPGDGYNVWEPLAGQLGVRWDLVSIICVNDKGTAATDDDVTTEINDPSDEFALSALETVTCTIRNAPAPAVINVDKLAGGQAGTWPVTLSGAGSGSVNVTDDGINNFTTPGSFATFGDRAAGSYTLTEGGEAGGGAFRPSGWSCTVVGGATTTASGAAIAVNANPGDVINCTITNTPVAPPNVEVTKTASPMSFPETATAPGSPIVYTVDVKNAGTEPFKITTLTDAVEGGAPFDLATATAGSNAGLPGATFVSNNCGTLINQTVAAGVTVTCQFSVAYTGRNAGDQIDDQVVGSVVDNFGRPDSDDGNATVTVTDVLPVITVDKQNVAVNGAVDLVFPGGLARYSIEIGNPSTAVEPITITSITDTMSSATDAGFGPQAIDITNVDGTLVTDSTCDDYIGEVLDPGESVTCEFTIDTTQIGLLAPGDTVTNTIAAVGADDDGNTDSAEDSATRNILSQAPQLTVFKSDGDVSIHEPGEAIEYSVRIVNQSENEGLEIQVISDTIEFLPAGGVAPGDLQARGIVTISDPGTGVVVDANLTGGVTLADTTCDDLIGTVLDQNDLVEDSGPDEATCTITLFLPGDAGDAYHDVVEVTGQGVITLEYVSGDNEAQTPVVNVAPAVEIIKVVDPQELPETGGQVEYTLTVTNKSVSSDPLTITELSDSVFGSFFPDDTTTDIDSTDCFDLEGVVLAANESVDCTITATISGNAGTSHDNIASVTGEDDEGNPASDTDDAKVTFTDVLPKIIVNKSADPTTVPESGELVTFTVTVENDTLEPVTTTALVDSIEGGAAIDLVGLDGSTCVADVTLAADDGTDGSGPDFYSCTFTRMVAQVGDELSETDVVTVDAKDDESNPASDDDDATVEFELIPPTVEITKTDGDATVFEPGGDVTYTIGITNTSFEPVTVTTLTDTITYEIPADVIEVDLLAPEAPVSDVECHDAGDATIDISTYSLASGETVTCSFVVALEGTAQIVRDVVNVVVVDNDGQPGGDSDEEATPILDVPPAVNIEKTADPVMINVGDEVTYTFVISNLSDIESITLLTLTDDKFGDIYDECVVGGMATELAPNDGEPGGDDETTCTIVRTLNETPGTTHVNLATVTAADDDIIRNEGEPVSDSDDASVLTMTPDTNVLKTVSSATRDGATGIWTIVYDIVVNNNGDGRATIDVNDEFKFGGGVEIVAGSVQVVAPAGVTLNPSFDGVGDTLIAHTTLAAEAEQTYTVTVKATIDEPVPGQGVCDADGVENGGFLNTVTVSSNFGPDATSHACAPFSTLTLVKNLVNNSGGTATLADFVLTASAGGVTHVQGTGTVTEAVPAGTYQLAETAKAGYASSGFACSTGELGATVNVPVASSVTCTVTNDDNPVADMAIVKTASVPQVGAGGAFTWLLDVTNNGPDPATNVVVNDIVPGQVTVTGVSSTEFTCTNSGNTVNCTKSAMAVGETGHIAITVSVPTAAADGDVTNIGTVTANQPDPNTSNNSDDASVTIVAQAPPPPTTPPPVILPPTGSNSTTPVTWAAISLMFIGGVVLLVSRRRRDHISID